jgi:hypothetical protein
VDFHPFRYFADGKWQPASLLPQPVMGSPSLSAEGGSAGDGQEYSVIRRWVAPTTGKVEVSGTLSHKMSERSMGDGVRARIVHSRKGKLAEEMVKNRKAELAIKDVEVEAGDTIDFVVDCKSDPEGDGFKWSPHVRIGGKEFNAATEFRGPEPLTLDAWAKYAQVLLETNEFAFVD